MRTQLGMALLAAAVHAAAAQRPDDTLFTRTDTMIAMRDGVKLYTVILTPKRRNGQLPILMTRTPYGADAAARTMMSGDRYPELIEDGFIFVEQDIRGMNRSQGAFSMNVFPDAPDPAPQGALIR